MSQPVDSSDFMQRGEFIDRLLHHIEHMVSIPLDQLPSPRVLAVDAPWGSGKSWIATRLKAKLQEADPARPVAFIDAFRYDHHDDVFALIAASILAELKPTAAKKSKFLKAAGPVIKAAAPAVVKGLIKGWLKVDAEEVSEAVADAAADGAEKASEKAIEKLLDSYANTQAVQDTFVNTLSELTKELSSPFVVIIDELDRCRPTFALEVLERIKHLFSAENVAFVLFWNGNSIRESVKHSYGLGTDADLYLSKFIAYTVRVPSHIRKPGGVPDRNWVFINRQVDRVLGDFEGRANFESALALFSEIFDASLRDAEKVIQLVGQSRLDYNRQPECLAFVALLHVTDLAAFTGLLKRDTTVLDGLSRKLHPHYRANRLDAVALLWPTIAYLSNPEKYHTAFLNKDSVPPTGEVETIIRAVYGSSGRPVQHEWLLQEAIAIADLPIDIRVKRTVRQRP